MKPRFALSRAAGRRPWAARAFEAGPRQGARSLAPGGRDTFGVSEAGQGCFRRRADAHRRVPTILCLPSQTRNPVAAMPRAAPEPAGRQALDAKEPDGTFAVATMDAADAIKPAFRSSAASGPRSAIHDWR